MSTLKPVTPAPKDAAFADAYRDRPLTHVTHDAPCERCGYNLRALPIDASCPECAMPVTRSITIGTGQTLGTSRVNRRWALLVLLGLTGMLLITPGEIWTVMEMQFGDLAFGSAPRLNVPGPKVWATPLVQRSLGGRPEWLGVYGTWLTLLNVASIFVITSSRTMLSGEDDRPVLRHLTRWIPALMCGGYLGFLFNAEDTFSRPVDSEKYAMIGVAGCELPCTVLLLIYLARVAQSVGLPMVRRQFRWAAVMTTLMISCALLMWHVAERVDVDRKELYVQAWSALYMAGCVATALLTLGATLRLMVELIAVLFPKFGKA